MNCFSDLNLPSPISKALKAMGFEEPTPIQTKAIPVALEGKDVIGCAQTGTGKTAAFCIPMLTHLLESPKKTGLVLAPTRELALQIETFWKTLTRFCPEMRSVVIIGGASMHQQIRGIKKQPRVIIGTPGRVVDHLRQKTLKLSDVEVLVLDEADRMLDMGFAPQLNEILKKLPQKRQTLFFTATWESSLDKLAKQYLSNPIRVSVGLVSQASSQVTQTLVATTHQQKNDALLDELNKRQGSVLIFARTKSRTDRVARFLSDYGIKVNRIHGDRTQAQRNSALNSFRKGQIRVLVATDIAARGIDVADIAHVVNYDLPQSSEDYIHRIGRTGRAGASGNAVSLVTPDDKQQWRGIARLLEKTSSAVPDSAFFSNINKSSETRGNSRRPRPDHAKHEKRKDRFRRFKKRSFSEHQAHSR